MRVIPRELPKIPMLKKDKYEHIGMKHVNTRTLEENSFKYDLVREA